MPLVRRPDDMSSHPENQAERYWPVPVTVDTIVPIVSFHPTMVARNFNWFVAVFAVKNGVVFETNYSFYDVSRRI